MADDTLKLFLLGKPKIVVHGRSHPDLLAKAQALLFYLAVEPEAHSRAALAALLWSEMPEEKARGNLRTAVSRLKPQFGPYLHITRSALALTNKKVWVDAAEFERGLSAAALPERRAALDLYRGDLLADLQLRDAPAFEEWLLVARVRLRQMALDGLEQLAHDTWAQGDTAQALADFRRLLTLDSYREGAHRGVMRLLADMGDRAGALAQFAQCRQILAADLAIEPAPSTMRLYEEIRQGDHMANLHSPASNLPSATTSFHGRSAELIQIAEALGDPGCRLLTLTGLGGVGKTRLALAAAHRLQQNQADWFPDGVFWVGLTAVSTPAAIITTIADALGFQFSGPAEGQTQLFNYLRQKRLLLVLDNLEQLVEAAPLFSDLLQAAPDVKLLATSREKLNLYEEWRLPLAGLPYPEVSAANFGEYEAVQLLAQRARRVDLGFDWQAQADDAAALCRLLEGLPLGLELAAAWVHVFSLAEIAVAIGRSQAELAVSWQNTPARHHSLAAALAYSWQMLTPPEQTALARLAVFRQGFTAAAAQAVAGAGATPRLLAGLVEKSLVRRGEHGRFDLHEQVRQFAWDKLGANQPETLTGHMRYFAGYLAARETAVTGLEQSQFLQAINREGENVRLAWETAVQQQDVHALSQMAGTLFHFYSKHGRQREGFAVFGAAVTMLQAGTLTPEAERLLAACLIWQGRCGELIHQGFAEPERLLQSGLALARQHELPVEMAQGLMGLGLLALIQNRPAESETCFQESLAVCQQANIPWTAANVLQLSAWLRTSQGEAARAREMALQASALQQATGDVNGEAAALNTLGKVESDLGNHEQAEAAYARAWALCRQTGHRVGQAQALTGLFGACMRQGKVETAVAHAQASLQLNRDAGNRLGEAIACHNLGYAWAAQHDHRQAADYYRQALAIYEALGGNEARMENTRRHLAESLQAAAASSD
ncbi:MAG: tetratricopeptide repeat protein [Ardenticatenaceae bacterium]|nr:tetratricopeptide repeat protein [Ardenticatenaceae bacterium]MCB8987302.1 tetratricopeptide repeat protein [Ardenticatenaceae bacterium]